MNCSNCSNTLYNAKCAGFYSSVVISILTLFFCFYKLAVLSQNEDKSVYIGIVTTIIGVFIPNPKLPSADIQSKTSEREPLVV